MTSTRLRWIVVGVVVLALLLGMVAPALAAKDSGKADKVRTMVVFTEVNQAAQKGLLKRFDAEFLKPLPIVNGWVVLLPPPAKVPLAETPGVRYVEDDARAWAIQDNLPWGVDRIDAELVWGGAEGATDVLPDANAGAGVDVAVIDTGIDVGHPDLDDNYQGGWDFVHGDLVPDDENGHGTHVAGIITAGNNNEGVIGVAPEANLWALKVFDNTGSGYYSDIIAAIGWCVDNEIEVANMSLGGIIRSRALQQACDNAYDAGVLLVAAAGNESSRQILYPAKYDSVIAVSATDVDDSLAWFSNFGRQIELAGPGVAILSTMPTYHVTLNDPPYSLPQNYAALSGTSMATPHVSATAALVIAAGILGSTNVRNQLDTTAEDLGDPGRDNYFGYGLVDAQAAAAPPPPDTTSPTVVGTSPGNATDVAVTTTVEITFSEPMSKDSAQAAFSISPLVDGSFSWSGETMVFTPTLNLDYETSYIYGVSTEAKDLAGNLLDKLYSWTFTTEAQPTGATMHIASATMSFVTREAGPNTFYTAVAKVTVVDASGVRVEGATVEGHWEEATIYSDSGITDANGEVFLKSDTVKNPATGMTFTFVVDNVAKDGWMYDSDANVETSASITVP